MWGGEPGVVEELEVAYILMIAGGQQPEDILAVIVPRAREDACCGRGDDGLARGEGWLREKALVRVDLRAFGVVHGKEAKAIDIVDLLHGLTEAEAEPAVTGAEARAVDLDPLIGVRFVP